MTGFVIYQGPSLLDGQPIVCIATVKSKNSKTGNMVQTWIMRADIDPMAANRGGQDYSNCGACPLRGIANNNANGVASKRGCYVLLQNAPLGIWRAYKRGAYQIARTIDAIAAIGNGRTVRLGSYGDMAAVPAWVSSALQSDSLGHTAYTHQAANSASSFDAARYMVSVGSVQEASAAWAKGQRTFRIVSNANEIVTVSEIECPSKRGVSCADCGLCGGSQVKAKSIAIVAHGIGKKNAIAAAA